MTGLLTAWLLLQIPGALLLAAAIAAGNGPHEQFEAEMNSGKPIVDNANDRLWGPNGEYDGPTCAADDCRSAVENDGDTCPDCEWIAIELGGAA